MSLNVNVKDVGSSPVEEQQSDTLVDILGGWQIVIYNDDVNTFDHVITCLEQYCDHTPEQAEQCSLIIHFKGKCAVKHGSNESLSPICEALCDKGLSAMIEQSA